EPRLLPRLGGGAEGEARVAPHAVEAGHVDEAGGVVVLDLRADARGIGAGLEDLGARDAALARQEATPHGLDVMPHGRDPAGAGDDHTIHSSPPRKILNTPHATASPPTPVIARPVGNDVPIAARPRPANRSPASIQSH